jgi:AcrR family transcriptional regulator
MEGVQGASIRSIARQAGCDPALIYYHFESKEAIFTALIERRIPLVLQDLRRIVADTTLPIPQRLWQVLGTYQRHLSKDAGFRAMVRGEMMRGAEGIKDALAKRVQPVMLELVGLLEEGIRQGVVRKDLVPLFGVFFLVRMELEILDLVPVMAQRFSPQPPELALAMAQRQWFLVFWRGIAARPDEPLPFELNDFDPRESA